MVRNLSRLLALLVAFGLPATAHAQWVPRPFPSIDSPNGRLSVQDTRVAPEPGVGPAVGFSLLGGAAGLLAGYAIGYPLLYQPSYAADVRRGCEDCGLSGALATAGLMVLGETVGVAVGAHLGNGKRGSFGADLGTSAGVLVLSALVAGAVNSAVGEAPAGLVVLAVSIPQIAAVVAVERHNGRDKQADGR